MAINSLGIVVVPLCSGDRLFRPNCSVSASAYFLSWHGRINVGTVVNSSRDVGGLLISCCLSSDSSSSLSSRQKTKLYVSDNLMKAFEQFGKLTLVTNRPRGFAFLRYETEEESVKAIDGKHGKFLDGRVTFALMILTRRSRGRTTMGRSLSVSRITSKSLSLINSHP